MAASWYFSREAFASSRNDWLLLLRASADRAWKASPSFRRASSRRAIFSAALLLSSSARASTSTTRACRTDISVRRRFRSDSPVRIASSSFGMRAFRSSAAARAFDSAFSSSRARASDSSSRPAASFRSWTWRSFAVRRSVRAAFSPSLRAARFPKTTQTAAAPIRTPAARNTGYIHPSMESSPFRRSKRPSPCARSSGFHVTDPDLSPAPERLLAEVDLFAETQERHECPEVSLV